MESSNFPLGSTPPRTRRHDRNGRAALLKEQNKVNFDESITTSTHPEEKNVMVYLDLLATIAGIGVSKDGGGASDRI